MKVPILLCAFLSLPLPAQTPAATSSPNQVTESEVVPFSKKEISPPEKLIKTEKLPPAPEHKTEVKGQKTSRDYREESRGTVLVGYQLLTTWLPGKQTVSYTYIMSENWSLEGEYAWSTLEDPVVVLDLGRLKERRTTLQLRHYIGNSFNFSFGAVYNQFTAHVGNDTLDSFGQKIGRGFAAENVAITGGFGNRWQWGSGVTLGIDWMRLNIPLLQTRVRDDVLKDIAGSSERSDIKKAIRTLNRIPTFVLFGLHLGYTF